MAEYSWTTKFNLYDRVIIDGDGSVIATVTAVVWRAHREPLYELSWISNGQSQTAWVEEPRIEEWE